MLDPVALSSPKGTELLESGDPQADARAFRRCLSQFATGVAVVTTSVGDKKGAVTVNSFSSVSLDPPLILWSIARTSRSFALFGSCPSFSVNVLASDQINVARHFSGSGEDKFAAASYRLNDRQLPVLDGTLAHFDCAVETRHEAGDHMIIIGRVLNYARYSGSPLLFSQGAYGVADEHPTTQVVEEQSAVVRSPVAWGDDLVSLIFEAHVLLSHAYEASRSELGLTISSARALASLYSDPHQTAEHLANRTFLGELSAEDMLDSLIQRGLAARSSDSTYHLTQGGRELREKSLDRWRGFCSSETNSLPPRDLQRACKTLQVLINQRR